MLGLEMAAYRHIRIALIKKLECLESKKDVEAKSVLCEAGEGLNGWHGRGVRGLGWRICDGLEDRFRTS